MNVAADTPDEHPNVTAGLAVVDSAQAAAVERIDGLFAHAWMVRTFIKHSPEVEDFPDLMHVVRAVFDTCRAIEASKDDPSAYLKIVRKKLSKLRAAAVQFRIDAPLASDHTNFKMAVHSLDCCVQGIEEALAAIPTTTKSESAEVAG